VYILPQDTRYFHNSLIFVIKAGFASGAQYGFRGYLFEQELLLSPNFRCEHIHNCKEYDFDHAFGVLLKSDLDVQQTRLSRLSCSLILD
jgi:hypothetical protein